MMHSHLLHHFYFPLPRCIVTLSAVEGLSKHVVTLSVVEGLSNHAPRLAGSVVEGLSNQLVTLSAVEALQIQPIHIPFPPLTTITV